MSKYVIDLEVLQSDPSGNPTVWKAKGFSILVFDKYGKQKLTPLSSEVCIEELQESGWMAEHDKIIFEQGKESCINDIGSIIAYTRNEGYDDGYNDGLKALQFTDGIEIYTNGMNDAWAAALKVVLPENAGGKYTSDEMRKIFGVEFDYQCLQKYTPQEVVRKFSDYDEQKKKTDQEIRVGDEVSFRYDDRPDTVMVVTDIYDQAGELHICGMDARGMQYAGKLAKCWKKTGRHFDQVSKLLEAMKENNG